MATANALESVEKSISLFELARLWSDDSSTRQWCRLKGLLPNAAKCPFCGRKVDWCLIGGLEVFRCRQLKNHPNRKVFKQSVLKNTWFSCSRLSITSILRITYCFAVKDGIERCVRETDGVNKGTVVDWYSFCREVCLESLLRRYENEGRMGGDGKVVEVDECKIGRRRYERGGVVEGQWVVGLIERESREVRLEVRADSKRDAETLLGLIEKHVEPGTTIISDCWKGYSCLSSAGYKHLTVNHSENFVDPESGACTNSIESQWRS